MRMNGYPRLSEIVSSGNTVYNRNVTQVKNTAQVNANDIEKLVAMLGCTVEVISLDGYNKLEEKDINTLYIVVEADEDTFALYFGEKKLDGGGGGGCEHIFYAEAVGNVIEGIVMNAVETVMSEE